MNIGILGAGSWAIAIAALLNENGHRVTMWEYSEKDAAMLQEQREHPIKLPGVHIAESITITTKVADLFAEVDHVVVAVPAQFVRGTLKMLQKEVSSQQIQQVQGWIIVAKGIECDTGALLTDVLADELQSVTMDKIAVLSGPSHAEEVGRRLPTTVVAASQNLSLAESIQDAFTNDFFRVYTNKDIIGVELSGSVKNVIALAAGICDGLGFGDNTKGALLTRGIAEMSRLGKKMGADEYTFAGLAGFGDLITTCFSQHSRNRRMGELLASGLSLDEALEKMTMVAEGVTTAKSVYELAQKLDIDMPITREIYKALYEGKSAHQAVVDLMKREVRPERY